MSRSLDTNKSIMNQRIDGIQLLSRSLDTNRSIINQRIDGIQLLRGLSCLIISLHHINFVFNLGLGTDFVEVFFVISGFVIMLSTVKSNRHYLSKRLIRIIPFYWLMTIVTYVGANIFPQMLGEVHISELLKSMFFIPFVRDGLRTTGIVRPIVGIAWTIELEAFFYLIFGIALIISKKYRGLISALVLCILVIFKKCFNSNNVALNFYFTEFLLCFVFGIILYYFMKLLWKFEMKVMEKLLFGAIAIILMIYLVFVPVIPAVSFLPRYISRGIPAMIVVCLMSLAWKDSIISQPFMFLGKISFSYYLVHYYVILIISKFICNLDTLTVKTVVFGLIAIGCSLITASICWYIVENKFTSWLKKKLNI